MKLNLIIFFIWINAYQKSEINNILKKHLAKKNRLEMKTFFEKSQSFRRINMPYYSSVTKKPVTAFRKQNIEFVPKIKVKSVRFLLGSTRDPKRFLKKSGIYEIFCQSVCDAV